MALKYAEISQLAFTVDGNTMLSHPAVKPRVVMERCPNPECNRLHVMFVTPHEPTIQFDITDEQAKRLGEFFCHPDDNLVPNNTSIDAIAFLTGAMDDGATH